MRREWERKRGIDTVPGVNATVYATCEGFSRVITYCSQGYLSLWVICPFSS